MKRPATRDRIRQRNRMRRRVKKKSITMAVAVGFRVLLGSQKTSGGISSAARCVRLPSHPSLSNCWKRKKSRPWDNMRWPFAMSSSSSSNRYGRRRGEHCARPGLCQAIRLVVLVGHWGAGSLLHSSQFAATLWNVFINKLCDQVSLCARPPLHNNGGPPKFRRRRRLPKRTGGRVRCNCSALLSATPFAPGGISCDDAQHQSRLAQSGRRARLMASSSARPQHCAPCNFNQNKWLEFLSSFSFLFGSSGRAEFDSERGREVDGQ